MIEVADVLYRGVWTEDESEGAVQSDMRSCNGKQIFCEETVDLGFPSKQELPLDQRQLRHSIDDWRREGEKIK
ncbi:hypothetical protein PtB15_8B630 [Puccinia triticina]|nr:hypothetical protein PtB15_8B630 [Puccinia triticina]